MADIRLPQRGMRISAIFPHTLQFQLRLPWVGSYSYRVICVFWFTLISSAGARTCMLRHNYASDLAAPAQPDR
eukprot:9839980-Alexandrium_andersonii.AAC.1